MTIKISFLLLILSINTYAYSQSQRGDLVKILIQPTTESMICKIGEKVGFEVTIYKYGQLIKEGEIEYTIGQEKMISSKRSSTYIKNGHAFIPESSLNIAGFLRCHVYFSETGKEYQKSCTLGIEPEKIEPTTNLPDDFDEFWKTQIENLKQIPLEPMLTLMPELCTPQTNYYHIRFKNISGYIYGILTIPKKEGKYPALLHLPGAGVRSYYGTAFKIDSCISLQIGIHGIPVNLYDSPIYSDLRKGALYGYPTFKLDDKEKYYFKRVYLGCLKAVDFIYDLPEFDGENIGVVGGSQGGGLSIVTASLDPRIKYLISYSPALCDLTGYLHKRAGGWPHLFRDGSEFNHNQIETSKYYDVVNFARNIKIPGFYSFGFNDNTCPPTSIYSALNVIKANKELYITYDSGHRVYSEQFEYSKEWMRKKLGIKTNN